MNKHDLKAISNLSIKDKLEILQVMSLPLRYLFSYMVNRLRVHVAFFSPRNKSRSMRQLVVLLEVVIYFIHYVERDMPNG